MSISSPSASNSHSESWSISEQLNLALAVVKSGDQNWGYISRVMNPLSGRPFDWYSQKNCAQQYKLLLEQMDSCRRKKVDGSESTAESIVRYLRTERIKEIESIIITQKEEIKCIEEDLEALKPGSGASKDQIQKIALRVLKEKNFGRGVAKKSPEKTIEIKESSEKLDENNIRSPSNSSPTSPHKVPPETTGSTASLQEVELKTSLSSNDTEEVEIKAEVAQEEEVSSVKRGIKCRNPRMLKINQSPSVLNEKIIPEEEINKEKDITPTENTESDAKELEKIESSESPVKEETLVKSEVEEEVNGNSGAESPKESSLEVNQDKTILEEINEERDASKVEEPIVERTPSPQNPCDEEEIPDTEDAVQCNISEEQDKIVNVEETTNSESSNLSEEEEKTIECSPDKENKMDEEVTFDEESSPMIEDSVLSKKESALTSTAKPVIIEITKPLFHSQKEDKQSDHESLESEEIIKSKRSTRATIKKENEPSASKSSGEDADIEDSIKITRRKNKHASEKQQNPDEESATPNPSLSSSSNSKRKSVIKVEDETLVPSSPVENVIENRRLSRVKDEVISGPILTRGSRRGSSRSSSPTGSVIMNEEISELSEPRTRTSTRRKSGKVTPAESEHESVPPSPAPSEEEHTWKKSAFSAIEDIKSCNHQILEAPGDPLGIVKKPFDLGTINKNLENGIYKTLPEFQRDIQLLLLNMVIVVPYSSEVYDQFNKIQQDINQIMSSLINNTLSLTKPVVSSKRKRTSSVLSATDANSSCSNGSSSKSKRRKTRGDD
ncbi:LOW QUALITY PROTEIN: uncharacterized protein [Lepeophtheirus salmonis]|uniref:LOW QUALITY PROTEIN: uncharacterized protein n=1 Tax=Lepeophtheirus salmonis TaxID=72036 RepID=UPI003AF38E2E